MSKENERWDNRPNEQPAPWPYLGMHTAKRIEMQNDAGCVVILHDRQEINPEKTLARKKKWYRYEQETYTI